MADPCVVGVKIKIHKFDVITMDGNAGGVWSIDREHCASISWSFMLNRAIMLAGGFVKAWNGASLLKYCSFVWRHVEYYCSMITNICVSSYVIPIHLLLILYFPDTSPCGTGRLKISYIWSCCALSCMGTSISSRNCPSATSRCVLRCQ